MSAEARVAAFIREELQWYIDETVARSRDQLIRRNIRVSDMLLQSLAGRLISERAAEMAFAMHGRFHDMAAGRGYTKGRYTGRSDRTIERKGRSKPSKWYARTKWGLVGQLTSNLSNKYIDTITTEARAALGDTP